MDGSQGSIISFVVLIAAFYLLIIRPQMKRQKDQKTLMASLAVDDRVITIGGIYGTIRILDDETVQLEVAEGVTITMARSAVARKIEE
ncbi:MAG: preprotein translocase subunit YajC [Actinobacteria bacterium HGW-Actinobacteria-6]|jgi:preprotein translocase subunit YajC|nr:MAG: preprotein translocase subunit YajC [Actinobacteria bacterium HGW-Actinobacteria-6]